MGLTNEHVGPKILAKIKIYVLIRAEILFTLSYEIPCINTIVCNVALDRKGFKTCFWMLRDKAILDMHTYITFFRFKDAELKGMQRQVFIHIMNFPLSLPPSYTKYFKTLDNFVKPKVSQSVLITIDAVPSEL